MSTRKGYTKACNAASNYDSISEDTNRVWFREFTESMKETSEAWHAKCPGYIGIEEIKYRKIRKHQVSRHD